MSDDVFSCNCPKCGSTLNIDSELNGKDVKCHECSFSFVANVAAVDSSSPATDEHFVDMSDSATVIDQQSLEGAPDMSNAPTKLDPQLYLAILILPP